MIVFKKKNKCLMGYKVADPKLLGKKVKRKKYDSLCKTINNLYSSTYLYFYLIYIFFFYLDIYQYTHLDSMNFHWFDMYKLLNIYTFSKHCSRVITNHGKAIGICRKKNCMDRIFLH